MCAVSAVGDNFRSNLPNQSYWPNIYQGGIGGLPAAPQVSKEDFDALKRDMIELKELLKAAKRYDDATGQPDCEMEDKVALIKRLADMVGVDLGDVFGK